MDSVEEDEEMDELLRIVRLDKEVLVAPAVDRLDIGSGLVRTNKFNATDVNSVDISLHNVTAKDNSE